MNISKDAIGQLNASREMAGCERRVISLKYPRREMLPIIMQYDQCPGVVYRFIRPELTPLAIDDDKYHFTLAGGLYAIFAGRHELHEIDDFQ